MDCDEMDRSRSGQTDAYRPHRTKRSRNSDRVTRRECQLLRVDETVKDSTSILESKVPRLDKLLNQGFGSNLVRAVVNLV